jgi:beta-glucosidase
MIYTKARETNEVTQLELENRELARKLAHEAIVLLKNDNNTLPLNVGKIALYGSGVTKTISGGTGSGEVRSRYYVNVYDGFKNKGFEITSTKWLEDYEKEFQEGLDKYPRYLLKKLAKSRCFDDLQAIFGSSYQHPFGRTITLEDVEASGTDVCCYILTRQVGEGKDKTIEEFKLTKDEIERIKFLSENYKKFVLILNTGSFMDISEIAKLEKRAKTDMFARIQLEQIRSQMPVLRTAQGISAIKGYYQNLADGYGIGF